MTVLNDKTREELKKVLEPIANPVKLVMFTQATECEYCQTTREMVEEVAALSDHVTAEVLDFVEDAELAGSLGVEKIPAVAVLGDRDYGIRFFGIPAGYEFMTFVETILDVGKREHGLSDATVVELGKVDVPVHLQVIVSPTWPYCPRAVRTAQRLAMASDHVRADMVEASEYPYLSVKYQVHGVPHTVINEEHSVVGAVGETELVEAVLQAISK